MLLGITLPETMTTYSPPIELRPVCSSDKSPRIDKPISFGDVSPSIPFDIRSMPPPPEQSSTFSNSSSNNQQLTSSLSISSDKLISLDTPQQTPTTMNPPLLFDDLSAAHKTMPKTINDHQHHHEQQQQQQPNQHQFMDGNGNGNNGNNGQMDKNSANNNHHPSSTSNGKKNYLVFVLIYDSKI